MDLWEGLGFLDENFDGTVDMVDVIITDDFATSQSKQDDGCDAYLDLDEDCDDDEDCDY